ncbi:unnamed protein product [Owenia fusiformis]|uniref:Uncharacterized protein n=1 Tax=Owenia fusiformis TaxID=6347 RepID=A0A8S4P6Q7_OWEFU|nr:unnamed protein product [Owenia fusiformis]
MDYYLLKNSSGTGSESSSKSSARPSNRPITVRKEDSKMMTKTPTLKLKPITVPPKTGAQSLYNVQPSKGPTTPVSAPPVPHRTPPSATPPTPTTPTPNSGVSGLGKATKSRKGSLSAVIDRLATKQQSKSHEPQQQITEFKVLERKPEIVSFESKPTSNTPSKEKRSSESIAKEKSVMKLDLSKTKQSKPSTGVSTPTKDSSKSATSNTKVTTPNSKVSTPNSKVSTPNSKVPSSISKSSTPNTKVSTPTRPEKSILKTPDVKKPENIIPTLPRKTESANNATMPRKPENVNTPAMPRKSESVNVPMMPAKSLVLNEETGQMEPIKDTPKVPIDPSKQVIGTDSDDKSKLDARISGERKGLFQTLQEMEKRKSQSPLHTQGKANPDTNSKPTENLRPKSEATPKLSVNVNNKGPVEIDLISPDDSNGNDIPALVPQFSDSFPPSGNVNPKDERPPLSPIEQRIEPISPPIIEPKQRRLVPLSPNSEGSPGLVIDFPNTPKSNTISPLVKRTVTPQPKTISPTPNNTEQVQSEGVSGAPARTASPSVSNTIVGVGVSVSPARAKDLVKTHTPSPHSSPLMLDDELMDAAITGGFGSNS